MAVRGLRVIGLQLRVADGFVPAFVNGLEGDGLFVEVVRIGGIGSGDLLFVLAELHLYFLPN